jgi:dipeptidase
MSYGIYIGRNHTADGLSYLAGYGDEPSSHWLEIIPRQSHRPGGTITVGVTPRADMPGHLTEIPQASETARHLRVSYSYYLGVPAPLTNGGLNEHGVAVRDIWSPSRPELVAMTLADQSGPNYSDLARLVLERARNAREAVEIIGTMIARHGYSCYGGNSHFIADAEEGWVVIEFAGSRGLWVAERLGPDSIRASRPGYIGDIPPRPTDNFRFPEHFIQTAIGLGWYDPKSGPFNVNRIYGDGKGPWDGMAWAENEMRARSARPEKIGLSDVIWAIGNARLTGDTAGYGQVVPLTHYRHNALRVMWHAPVGAVAAPLVPVFMGQTDVPAEYGCHRYLTAGEAARFLDPRRGKNPDTVSQVPQGREVTRSAFYVFKRLMHLAFQQPDSTQKEVWDHWRRTEARLAEELPSVLRSAEILCDAGEEGLAARLLTEHSRTRLLETLADAEALVAASEARLRLSGALNSSPVPKVPDQLW